MMAQAMPTCRYCAASGTIRQVCTEQYVWGGVPFSCARCGGAFFRRTISAEISDDYWEGDTVNEEVYTVPEVQEAFKRKYERNLSRLHVLNGAGKNLLEVGCGSGIFLRVAASRGWTVFGLDTSPQAVEMTRKSCPGTTVVCAPLEKAGFDPAMFDVIALWDVIEHVDDPEALLKEARSLLAPGGHLIMETPDEGCLARHLVRFAHKATAGRASLLRALYYPAHRWYFSRQAMAKVLQRVGFDQIRFYREQTVREFGQRKGSAYGMVQNWPYRLAAVIMKIIPVLHNKMVVVAAKS